MNNTPTLLSLPRLHKELLPGRPACSVLWPGLPHAPAEAWMPAFPLSQALAEASLSDFRRACRDGACGSPVHALSLENTPDLTGEELRALREMTGLPSAPPEQPLRLAAQHILLLAWLKEEQALELAAIERKIRDSRASLRGLISGTSSSGTEGLSMPSEQELPSWDKMLAAFLAFIPDLPEGTAFFVTSREMAEALRERFTPSPSSAPLPDGCSSVTARVSELIGLCPACYADRLLRSPDIEASKELLLVIPGDSTF